MVKTTPSIDNQPQRAILSCLNHASFSQVRYRGSQSLLVSNLWLFTASQGRHYIVHHTIYREAVGCLQLFNSPSKE